MGKKKETEVKDAEKKEEKVEFAVTEEKDGVHVRPVVDGKVIDTPVEKVEKTEEETTEEDLEKDSETEGESEGNSEEEEEVEETETEESEEEKKEDLPSVSLDNKPMSPLIKEEEEVIPPKFVPNHRAKKENKRELLVHNGRVYKKISSTHGIWADNGQAFSLSALK